MSGQANSVDLIIDIVKDARAAQMKQKDTLETKASTMVAFVGVIFALLMTGYETLTKLFFPSRILIVISLILFGISVIIMNTVTWVKQFRSDPNPMFFTSDEYLNKEPLQTKLQLLSNWSTSWEENNRTLERNALFLRFGYIVQTVAFLCLGIGLLITVV